MCFHTPPVRSATASYKKPKHPGNTTWVRQRTNIILYPRAFAKQSLTAQFEFSIDDSNRNAYPTPEFRVKLAPLATRWITSLPYTLRSPTPVRHIGIRSSARATKKVQDVQDQKIKSNLLKQVEAKNCCRESPPVRPPHLRGDPVSLSHAPGAAAIC